MEHPNNVQRTAERWLEKTFTPTDLTEWTIGKLNSQPPMDARSRIDNPATIVENLLVEAFLHLVRAKINADERIECKQGDYYALFELMQILLQDDHFDEHTFHSIVKRR